MNVCMTMKVRSLLVFCPIAMAATLARAVPLPDPSPNPFVDVPLSGTTAVARPELAGVVLEDLTKPYLFLSNDGVSYAVVGSVQSRVIRSDLDGTLVFSWRIIPEPHGFANPLTQDGVVAAFRVGGFGDFALDADFRTDSLGNVGPHTARHFGGGFVNFLFDPGVGPPDESYFVFLDTRPRVTPKSASTTWSAAPTTRCLFPPSSSPSPPSSPNQPPPCLRPLA